MHIIWLHEVTEDVIENVTARGVKAKQMEKLQRKINTKDFADDDKHRRLQCNTDP